MNDLKSVKNFVPTGEENSSLKSELESFCVSVFTFELWLEL